MSALIGLLMAGAAAAGELVLHEGGDPELLRSRVVHLTGAEPSEIRVVDLATHFGTAPPRLEPGDLTPCDELIELEMLEESLDRAKGAVAYLEWDKAAKYLRQAEQRLACQRDAIDPILAARLHLDIAAVALERNDKHGAGRAYRAAFRYQPDLTWSDDLPAAGKELFDAAAMAIYMNPPAELSFEPGLPEGLRIDGRRPDVFDGAAEVPAGHHVFQFGVDTPATLSADLRSGPAVLTVPSVPDDALALLDQPTSRGDLDTKLLWTAPSGSVVWLARDDELWRHELGSDVWSERWAPVAERSRSVRKRVRLGTAIGLGGAGLAVVGGVMTGVFFGAATAAAADVEGAFDDGELQTAKGRYSQANGALGASRVALGLGAATAVVGFTFTLGRSDIHRDLMGSPNREDD